LGQASASTQIFMACSLGKRATQGLRQNLRDLLQFRHRSDFDWDFSRRFRCEIQT
jgi:hypothetical protein